jgi:hypothetical protein
MSFVFFNIRFIGGRKRNKERIRVRDTRFMGPRQKGVGGRGVELGVVTKQGALRVVSLTFSARPNVWAAAQVYWAYQGFTRIAGIAVFRVKLYNMDQQDPPVYACVFQVVSFPQVFLPKPCIHLSCLLCAPRLPPSSSFKKTTNNAAKPVLN